MSEVIYESSCSLCEEHKTDLGTLKKLEKVVQENFPTWTSVMQQNLLISWFEQYKTDERMKYIEKSKNKTTEQIQKYKQSNIKAINQNGG